MERFYQMSNPPTIMVIKYIHHNIPIFPLMVMTMLNHIVFENKTNEKNCTDALKAGTVISFAALVMLNFVWIIICCDYDTLFTRNNWRTYAWWRCIISIFTFYAFNNYINKGAPFNCFIEYSETLADTLFYISILIVINISCIEHMGWKKQRNEPVIYDDPPMIEDQNEPQPVEQNRDEISLLF